MISMREARRKDRNEKLKLGSTIKIVLLALYIIWLIAYLLGLRPPLFEKLGMGMGLITVILVYAGFLVNSFILFVYPKWRKRKLPEVIFWLALASYFIFINLFAITVHSPYGALGIVVMLIFSVLALIEEEIRIKGL